MSLNGKTMFISGASRGIGLAIAKRAAQDGANIALIAKTAEPHPKLPGTVYTAAKELEEAGGQALPIVGDVRDPDSVESAVAKAVEQFGGIDICVNNASAINLGSITEVPMKRFDLMNGIQVRGTYAVSQACIPHMKGRENPHILTLSPPVLLGEGMAEADGVHDGEVRHDAVRAGDRRGDARRGHRVEHAVAAHAGGHRRGAEPARRRRGDGPGPQARGVLRRGLRHPQQARREYTGNTLLCEDVLLESGVTDLSVYDCVPGGNSASTSGWTASTRRDTPGPSAPNVGGAATPALAALIEAGVPHEVVKFEVVRRARQDSGDVDARAGLQDPDHRASRRVGGRGSAGAGAAVAEGGRRSSGRGQSHHGRTRRGRAGDRLRGRRGLPVRAAQAAADRRGLLGAGLGPGAVQRRQAALGRRGGPADLIRLTGAITADIRA